MAVFTKQGVYWIDYYVNGVRKRERIGPDKKLAATVLKKRKVEIAEGKFLDKHRPVITTFDELVEAYLAYGERQRKRSLARDRTSVKALTAYFGGKRLTEMTPASIEAYRTWRHTVVGRLGQPMTPASVNRELACLKRAFNVALKGLIVLKGGMPTSNPVTAVSLEPEHNERDRVLTVEEFEHVYAAAASWLKPMLTVAYHTGMRQGEIRSLHWEQVDTKHGAIHLRSHATKTVSDDVKIPLCDDGKCPHPLLMEGVR
jgi:integrase